MEFRSCCCRQIQSKPCTRTSRWTKSKNVYNKHRGGYVVSYGSVLIILDSWNVVSTIDDVHATTVHKSWTFACLAVLKLQVVGSYCIYGYSTYAVGTTAGRHSSLSGQYSVLRITMVTWSQIVDRSKEQLWDLHNSESHKQVWKVW